MKVVVVTALIGPAESAPPVGPADPGVRYVCVTDREAPGWERLPPPDDSPRRAARRVKTSVCERFPMAEASIWIDASFDLVASPREILIAAAKVGAPVVGFAHPDRSRISDEGREIARLKLAPAADVERQVASYRLAGFDTDDEPQRVLTTTGMLVRWHTPAVARFCARWWDEMEQHTLRDQLSVDYAAWRAGVKVGHLPGNYRDNAFVRYDRVRHRQRRAA